MKRSTLTLAILLSLGLTACGGGGGDDSTDSSVSPADACTNIDGTQASVPAGYSASGTTCTLIDACLNFDGTQVLDEVSAKGFMRDEITGECQIDSPNARSLSFSGADMARWEGLSGHGVGISVIDTGVMMGHVELGYRADAAASYDYYGTIDPNTYENVTDADPSINDVTDHHGTAVASLALGSKVGVAPGAGWMHIKASDGGAMMSDTIINGIHRSHDFGYSIINLSNTFGQGLIYYNGQYDSSDVLQTSDLNSAVMIYSGGNWMEDYSADYDTLLATDEVNSGTYVDAPLIKDPQYSDNIIYVGGWDSHYEEQYSGSAEPGWRDYIQARWIVADACVAAYAKPDEAANNVYGDQSETCGTSYAAPAVAGAMALLMEANTSLSAPEAAQVLLDTARKDLPEYKETCHVVTDKFEGDVNCGYMKFGQGIMDIPAALEAIAAR